MAEVAEDRGATLCEDENDDDDGVDEIDSEEDEEDWEMGDDDSDGGNETMYDSPLDKIDEILHLGSHLTQIQ
jgi:hypothetical protein